MILVNGEIKSRKKILEDIKRFSESVYENKSTKKCFNTQLIEDIVGKYIQISEMNKEAEINLKMFEPFSNMASIIIHSKDIGFSSYTIEHMLEDASNMEIIVDGEELVITITYYGVIERC